MSLLEVKNLKMYYEAEKGVVSAVDNVSLNVDPGETVGIVGESGCGKTSLGLSILRLLPPNGKIVDGEIIFKGEDLLKLSEGEMRSIRGSEISMIFQSAFSSLNPLMRVVDQVAETLRAHKEVSKQEAEKKVAELFDIVRLPRSRMTNYPYEFSGGMAQRVFFAVALICNPKLIIADEPTSALDVVIQDQVLQEVQDIQRKLRFAMIMISHDISVIAETCNMIAVMYAGQIVEYGDTFTILKKHRHPYTKALMSSIPSTRGPLKRLTPILGVPPSLLNPPLGCRFEPRCPMAKEICKKEPKVVQLKGRHYFRCHFALD